MSNSTEPSSTNERIGQGARCAKCQHVNPPNRHECERCGAHLYISCNDCGHRNSRASTRCKHCGRRLHRSLWQKLERRLFKKGRKITLLQVLLLILAVYAVYKVIVKIAEYEPPLPE